MKRLLDYILHNHPLMTLMVIVILLFFLQIKEILVAFFISYIIMTALYPFVDFLKKQRVPNVLASAIVFVTALLIVILLIFPLVPFFITQLQQLIQAFPTYLGRVGQLLNTPIDISSLQSLASLEIELISENAFALTKSLFSGFFSLISILVIAFYLLINHKVLDAYVVSLFPHEQKQRVMTTLDHIEEKLGAWLRGQIILSFFIGLLTWIALTLLGVNFALPLALVAGILEIVPTIGPIIAAVPALIVAFATSPELALLIVLVYIAIQLIENNLLVPKIMEKAVGLNPIVIILAVGIGAKLMGVLGALLAIPFLSMLIIITKNLRKE